MYWQAFTINFGTNRSVFSSTSTNKVERSVNLFPNTRPKKNNIEEQLKRENRDTGYILLLLNIMAWYTLLKPKTLEIVLDFHMMKEIKMVTLKTESQVSGDIFRKYYGVFYIIQRSFVYKCRMQVFTCWNKWNLNILWSNTTFKYNDYCIYFSYCTELYNCYYLEFLFIVLIWRGVF